MVEVIKRLELGKSVDPKATVVKISNKSFLFDIAAVIRTDIAFSPNIGGLVQNEFNHCSVSDFDAEDESIDKVIEYITERYNIHLTMLYNYRKQLYVNSDTVELAK